MRGCLYAVAGAARPSSRRLQIWWVTTAAPGVASRALASWRSRRTWACSTSRGASTRPASSGARSASRSSPWRREAREASRPASTRCRRASNTFAVLSLLEGGKVLKHPVLLREGSTLAELARAVEAEGLARADDVMRVGRDPLFLRTLEIPAPSGRRLSLPRHLPVRQGRARPRRCSRAWWRRCAPSSRRTSSRRPRSGGSTRISC